MRKFKEYLLTAKQSDNNTYLQRHILSLKKENCNFAMHLLLQKKEKRQQNVFFVFMLSIDNIRVDFGGTNLFHDVSFIVNKRDRIALVGKNGAGKSTLLKIIAGQRQPTAGALSRPKDFTVDTFRR